MATTLSVEVLSLLVRVGRSSDPDAPEIESMCAPLRGARRCATLHWSEWDEACSALSIEDHVAMLKGVTLAERHAEWQGGSVSPIIWVYRSLEPRLSMQASQDLARWVQARSNNPYAPFGSMVLARHFRPDEDLGQRSGLLSDLLKSRRLSDHLDRMEEHDRRTQAAKVERIERQARAVRAHQERKALRDDLRRRVVTEGLARDAEGRVRLVVDRTDLPLLAFPLEWAEVGEEGVSGLSEELLERLEQRVCRMKRGPWSKLWLRVRVSRGAGRHRPP